MPSLLLKNAALIATFDDAGREIPAAGIYIEDHRIRKVGPMATLPAEADQVIDLTDHLVLPGLVNTHHHLYQTLTRVVAQDADLFTWLKTLYPIWARLTDEGVYISTLTGLAELMLSGCTTSSDHLYLYPNDCTLDSQIRAAREIGIRFHAARGSMSLGASQGGLPPDRVTENEAAILKDSQRLIETYHDPEDYAMLRLVLAPCSPFSVTADLMRESAALARQYRRVHLHTHLAETLDEERFCLEKFGMRPVDYVAALGWTGCDCWHAHCVHMNTREIEQFARSGTGITHCPSSNMRLASGIAPVPKMRRTGVKVGLGVDGSASNDGSHLLAEARQALLIQRIAPQVYADNMPLGGREGFAGDPAALSAREALWLATRGGAAVLGREDIGALEPGKAADLIAIDLNRLQYAGAGHDPVAAAVFCHAFQVDFSMIHGKVVVQDGQLLTLDLQEPLRRHRALSQAMLTG
ncbi:MAG: 8-oxoguanine deaminase [Thiothrix sp.]|nr:8-oxoguanine deaminase [Thiothrix sp.]